MKELFLAISVLSLQTTAAGPKDSPAIEELHAEIEKYMAIRRGLLDELSGPTANSSATQLNHAADALAAGIQRRRPNAKPGAIFTPAAAEALKRRISDAVQAGHLGPVLATIDDESGGINRPTVYLRFPAAAQMATMPPSVLASLPALPKELEYRIVGSYLVLRDIDAALVLDFIPAAVPRK
jgi:hypothetical protein